MNSKLSVPPPAELSFPAVPKKHATDMKSRISKKANIVIVEDHPMFREHLVSLIEKASDLAVVGEADNIKEGFALIRRVKPDVAIVDISLKGSNGLELLKDLR